MLERRGLIGSVRWCPDNNGIMSEEDLLIAFIVDKKLNYNNFFDLCVREKKKIYTHTIFIFQKDKDKLEDGEDHFHMSDFYMDVVDDAPKPHFVRFKRILLENIKAKNALARDWKVDDFPKMKRSDPLAKYYGARRGEIYEILLSGELIASYRVII